MFDYYCRSVWYQQNPTFTLAVFSELLSMCSSIEEWRLDLHGSFPRELESRGVLDPRCLPNYAYRDDGLLVHKALDAYVAKMVKHFYGECIWIIKYSIRA